MKIVEVWYEEVHQGGDGEEEQADAAADAVYQTEGAAVSLDAGSVFISQMSWLSLDVLITLDNNLHQLPVCHHSVVNTEVIYKSRLWDVQRTIADKEMRSVPGLDDDGLAVVVVEEMVAEGDVIWDGERQVGRVQLPGVLPHLVQVGGGAAYQVLVRVGVEQDIPLCAAL